jgi:hypothetical protein
MLRPLSLGTPPVRPSTTNHHLRLAIGIHTSLLIMSGRRQAAIALGSNLVSLDGRALVRTLNSECTKRLNTIAWPLQGDRLANLLAAVRALAANNVQVNAAPAAFADVSPCAHNVQPHGSPHAGSVPVAAV